MGAKYVLHIPRKTEIERIMTSNGRITVENIESAARLKTSNGSVRVNKTTGNLEVETSNAGVELVAHDGPATVHTSNGSIKADGVQGLFRREHIECQHQRTRRRSGARKDSETGEFERQHHGRAGLMEAE